MVKVQRLNDNKAIRVTWMVPTVGDKIVSYDVQYRTVDQPEGTTLTVTSLSLIVTGLSGLSKYEVCVRANFEGISDDNTLGNFSGPWSDWVESPLKDCSESVCV